MRRLLILAAAGALVFGALAINPGRAAGANVGPWYEYNGHSYSQLNDMSWVDAEVYAESLGGYLVTINDQGEQDWLAGTFTDPDLSIGYNDKAVEGTWEWVGDPSSYENWAPGEPTNSGDGENVAVMNAHGESDQWNDVDDNGSAIIEVNDVLPGNDGWDQATWVDDTFDDWPDMAHATFQADEPRPCAVGDPEGSVWYWFWNPEESAIRIEIDGDDGNLTAALYGPFGDQPGSTGDFEGMGYPAEQGPCTFDTGPDFAWTDTITPGIYYIQLTSSHDMSQTPEIHVQRNWAYFWVSDQSIQVTSATVDRAGNLHFEGTAVCELLSFNPDPDGGYPAARFDWTDDQNGYYWYQTDGWASQALGRKTLLEGGGRGRIDCTNVDENELNHWYVDMRSYNGKFGPNWTNLDMSIGDDTCTEEGCFWYGFAGTYDYVKVTKAH